MRRREWLGGFAGAALAGGGGCARRAGPGGDRTIRVAASPYVASSPFYLAYEEGYFAQRGLRVEVLRVANSNQAIPLLAGGQIDVALFSISPSQINAIARGAQLRIVAAREIASPDCGTLSLCARRAVFSNGPSDLKRLRGKRVAIYGRSNAAEFSLDAILSAAGLTAAAVQVVTLPPSEAVVALLAGSVDAILTDSIATGRALASLEVVTLARLATVCPGFQFSFMLFGDRLLHGDPTAGARFLRAYLRGNREFMAGKTPKFLEQLARDGGLDPGSAMSACRQAFSPDGSVNLQDLQRFIDWAVKKGYCRRKIEAAQMVDTRFLTEARKEGEV